MLRGRLICLEGLDRAGKSTHAARLSHSLAKAQLFRFPNRQSETGQIINNYL